MYTGKLKVIYDYVCDFNLLDKDNAKLNDQLHDNTEAVDATLQKIENMTVSATDIPAGSQGAQFAEDAWLMGQIAKEDRNTYVKELAWKMIRQAGFEVTVQIE